MCGLEQIACIVNVAAAVVVWLIFIIIISIFLTFLALILVSCSSALGSRMTAVPGMAISYSSEQGPRGCPGTSDALPMVEVATLAIFCARGRAVAGDSMVEAASTAFVGR